MQTYSNPARANDPHALPDVEVFYVSHSDLQGCHPDSCWRMMLESVESPKELVGWYYWHCLPGCLPDSDPTGPFATREEAVADAQDGCDDTDPDTEDKPLNQAAGEQP